MRHFFITLVMFLSTFYASTQNAKSYYEKALMKIELEKYEDALPYLDKALEMDTLNTDAFFQRGFIKAMMLKHEGALIDFNRAILLNPFNAQYYSERGISKLNLGDRDGACEDWKKADSMGIDAVKDLIFEYCP